MSREITETKHAHNERDYFVADDTERVVGARDKLPCNCLGFSEGMKSNVTLVNDLFIIENLNSFRAQH